MQQNKTINNNNNNNNNNYNNNNNNSEVLLGAIVRPDAPLAAQERKESAKSGRQREDFSMVEKGLQCLLEEVDTRTVSGPPRQLTINNYNKIIKISK